MRRYLLDTSALLALRDNEVGAEQVAALLYEAQDGKIECLGCFLTLMEIFYRVWKDENPQTGRLAYEQSQALPITWLHEEPALLEKAAELKATQSLSLADAWIAACALLQRATLVHKDPELMRVECEQLVLPFMKSAS
jgi:predicted nucleic acid-binding protein